MNEFMDGLANVVAAVLIGGGIVAYVAVLVLGIVALARWAMRR